MFISLIYVLFCIIGVCCFSKEKKSFIIIIVKSKPSIRIFSSYPFLLFSSPKHTKKIQNKNNPTTRLNEYRGGGVSNFGSSPLSSRHGSQESLRHLSTMGSMSMLQTPTVISRDAVVAAAQKKKGIKSSLGRFFSKKEKVNEIQWNSIFRLLILNANS